MSAPVPGSWPRAGVLLVGMLALLGLVAIGRLAMEAWLNRPAPAVLPEIGATCDEATPFLLVVIDGLRESSAFAADDPPMPWFQSLARRGVGGVARTGDPTLTAPCVRTLLTGRRPDLLTAFNNFTAREVRGSLIEYLAKRGGRTAHGGDAAVFQFCRSYYLPKDVLQFPDQGPVDQGHSDRKAVPFVAARVAEGATVVSLHLTGPDHAGHKYGATGREYWQACRVVDEQIAPIVEDFLARHPGAYVLVASDHGVSSMGTHGGGESDAKRAPFAMVGPDVAQASNVEIEQAALAPTLAVLMGLPIPPLADAPPEASLMRVDEARKVQALSDYVEARLQIARDLRSPGIDAIERRRAELSVSELAPDRRLDVELRADLEGLAADLNLLVNPSSAGYATAALLLAALFLVVLVGVGARYEVVAERASRVVPLIFALGLLALNLFSDWISVTPLWGGVLLLVGCALALWATRAPRSTGALFTLACLGALPVLTSAGVALQSAFTQGVGTAQLSQRMGLAGVGALAIAAALLRPARLIARLRDTARAAPGLVPAFGGVAVGFTLTLRPFIDPHVHLMLLYALLALGVLGWMARQFLRQGRARWEALAFLGIGLLLFGGTRVWEYVDPRADGGTWVSAVGPTHGVLLGAGAACSALVLLLAPRRGLSRADAPGLVMAVLALLGAFSGRVPALAEALADQQLAGLSLEVWQTFALNALSVLALLLTLVRGTPDGRLLVRVIAAAALARRLALSDAEFAAFALTGVGCMLAARLQLPRSRLALAWLAIAVLLLRTAVFHAMGFVESFSTLDVGAAFKGLGEAEAQALDAAGGPQVTWQVQVAGVQLALRMALPWILLLAAMVRAAGRTHAAAAPRLLVGDIALSFAARGAAIAAALWAWWMSVWWTTLAYTVYAFAAADVVLLLVCAGACGVFGERRASVAPAPPSLA